MVQGSVTKQTDQAGWLVSQTGWLVNEDTGYI